MNGGLRAVAEREFRDPFRSGTAWPVLLLFVLLFAGPIALAGGGTVRITPSLPSRLEGIVFLFVPLATLGFGYDRIAGARESGEIRLLLAPPHSRTGLVLATFAGRAAFTAVAVTAGYLAAAVAYVVVLGTPEPTLVVGGYLLTLALGVAVVGLAVGLSAAVSTSAQATMLAAVAFLTTLAFWGTIPTAVRYVASGLRMPTGPTPTWATEFVQAVPQRAFTNLVAALTGNPGPDAVTASPAGAATVLVAWTVVPLAVGLARFRRADL